MKLLKVNFQKSQKLLAENLRERLPIQNVAIFIQFQRWVIAWTYYKWTVYDLSFFDHDDRHRHLAVRILMTTSKWLDNDDYVIM